MESAVTVALCNERMAHYYNNLHNAYGNKWLTCLPIYSLQQIINLESHRAVHIPFGSSFLKELKMMLKTQQFFTGLPTAMLHIYADSHRALALLNVPTCLQPGLEGWCSAAAVVQSIPDNQDTLKALWGSCE